MKIWIIGKKAYCQVSYKYFTSIWYRPIIIDSIQSAKRAEVDKLFKNYERMKWSWVEKYNGIYNFMLKKLSKRG